MPTKVGTGSRPTSVTNPEQNTPETKGVALNGAATPDHYSREQVFDIFRRWGYLQAELDPLGQYLAPEPFPTAAPEGEMRRARRAATTAGRSRRSSCILPSAGKAAVDSGADGA